MFVLKKKAMSLIKNNPIMNGASGMLGKVVVYRQFRGKTLMCNRPVKSRILTPHQQKMKSRFLEAVAFAKKQIADPVTKALYQPGPESKFTSAYAAALADYLKRPVVESVDVSGYQGNAGDVIVVKASDVARTLMVAVSVFGVDGNVIDHGDAVENVFTDSYVFRASHRNAFVRGSKVLVTVKDRPGNIVVSEIFI